jgi:hypothetical protein
MEDLCLIFKESSILFSKVVVLAYIPTALYEGSFPPHSCQTFAVLGVLDDGYSNRGEVES